MAGAARMNFPFEQATCEQIAKLCRAFARHPAPKSAVRLKRAAVAITVVEADTPGVSAFLLTRRANA
jgi:hypothetical protein